MKSNLLVGVFALVIVGSLGQVKFNRACPTDRPIVKRFDVAMYLGLWYEISRYEQIFEKGGECVQASYSLNDDGSVDVFNSMTHPPSTQRIGAHGKAVLSDPDTSPLEGRFNVTFSPLQPSVSNYWILDTDYTHYAIINSCRKGSDDSSSESAWILSRTPQLDESVQSHVDNVIDLYLSRENLRITKQDAKSCNY